MEPEAIEHTLCTVSEVFVFKLPPRASAAGHKASDWGEPVWKGRLHVVAKGDDAMVQLLEPNENTFAVCPVRRGGPKAVEAVLDSSRYFVLRIEDGSGRHAFIGVGFEMRGDAFDFNVALSDHEKHVSREKEAPKSLPDQPERDFSLKEGQTLNIKVKTKKAGAAGSAPATAPATDAAGRAQKKGSSPKKAGAAPNSNAAGSNSGILPPPPPGGAGSGGRRRRRHEPSDPPSATAAPAQSGGDDLLDLGFGAPPSAAAAPAPAPAPAASDDPFAGSADPFASAPVSAASDPFSAAPAASMSAAAPSTAAGLDPFSASADPFFSAPSPASSSSSGAQQPQQQQQQQPGDPFAAFGV